MRATDVDGFGKAGLVTGFIPPQLPARYFPGTHFEHHEFFKSIGFDGTLPRAAEGIKADSRINQALKKGWITFRSNGHKHHGEWWMRVAKLDSATLDRIEEWADSLPDEARKRPVSIDINAGVIYRDKTARMKNLTPEEFAFARRKYIDENERYHRISERIKYAAGGVRAPWKEELHPRASDGKFGTAGRVKAAVAKKRGKPFDKMNITDAQKLLAAKGVSMLGVAPYDLANKTASYNVALPDGTQAKWTSDQIKSFLQGGEQTQPAAPKSNVTTDFAKIHQQFPPHNPNGHDTQAKYRDPQTGQYTPERQQLHAGIVSQLLRGLKPSQQPTVYMLGGGTASGKSSLVKSGKLNHPHKLAHIDSDGIKEQLPEYAAQIAAKDTTAAAYNHEESSDVSSMAVDQSLANKFDVLMDGTGDSSIEKLRDKVTKWKAAGHRVSADYCTVPTETAIKWANDRGAKTGRVVSESVLRGIHAGVSQVVPQAISEGLYDDFRLWDNSTGESRLIATAAGTQLQIHDQQAWQTFLDKGK